MAVVLVGLYRTGCRLRNVCSRAIVGSKDSDGRDMLI